MNQKHLTIVSMALFVLLASVMNAHAHNVVADTTGYSLSSSSGSIAAGQKDGEQIVPNFNITNITIQRNPSVTAAKAYILDASQAVIAGPVSFSGNNASFTNTINLTKGVTYFVAVDNSGGAAYNRQFATISSPPYNITGTNLNWTGVLNAGTVQTTNVFDIDEVYSVRNDPAIDVPSISGLNCTSCNPPFGSNTSPFITSDTTPTFKFNTNVSANCRVGNQDWNFTTMGNSRNCTGGEGTTSHTCTLTSQDALPAESGQMYLACQNSYSLNQSFASSSGPLQINGIATTSQAAIDYGIHQSVIWPGATVYSNQQVYLRDLNNNQKLATVDRVVAYGSQRWIFNVNNVTTLGLFNLSNSVYSLEMANMTFLQIEANVTAFINSTKT